MPMKRNEAVPADTVAVAFAANNGFVPYFAACFQSLLEHTSQECTYDVVLIHTDISPENQALLLDMALPYPQVSLRFYDAQPLIGNHALKAGGHISVETYFRFLIQQILPEYDKVLYLDCDMILNADVAELYRTDVEGYLLAAARDPEFLGHLNGADPEICAYIHQQLPLDRPEDYFQAGVILFNVKEMRRAYTLEQWLRFASQPYRYNDQDVLNIYCQGRVKFLDMSWNLLTDCDHTRISQVIVHAPEPIRKAYFDARKAPKIIHYAGHRKPWQKPTEDMASCFWSTMRKTPFYEEALFRMSRFAAREQQEESHREHSFYWRLRRFGKKLWKECRKKNGI